MSKCNFSLDFTGSSGELENKLKAEIEAYGGQLDTAAGTVNIKIPVVGTISGSYTFAGQQINMQIDSKPMLLSCDQIEKQVEKFVKE